MPYEFYKVVHITGIFMIMTAVGAHLLNGFAGGEKGFVGKKFVGILHGLGLVITFVAGFGLMARIGLFGSGWPAWVYLKLVIWLVFGMVILLPRKFPQYTGLIWIGVIATGSLASFLARYKPF